MSDRSSLYSSSSADTRSTAVFGCHEDSPACLWAYRIIVRPSSGMAISIFFRCSTNLRKLSDMDFLTSAIVLLSSFLNFQMSGLSSKKNEPSRFLISAFLSASRTVCTCVFFLLSRCESQSHSPYQISNTDTVPIARQIFQYLKQVCLLNAACHSIFYVLQYTHWIPFHL